MNYLTAQFEAVETSMPFRMAGQIHGISGLTLEAAELPLPVGSLCRISSFGGRESLAEVIGFRQDHDARRVCVDLGRVDVAGEGRVAGKPACLHRLGQRRVERVGLVGRAGADGCLLGRLAGGERH